MEPMMATYPPAIAKALHQVMTKVGYVQKKDRNDFQKYNYAGEGALLDVLRPAMVEAGLVLIPSVETLSEVDQYGNVSVRIAYTLAHSSGEVWPDKIYAVGKGNDKNSKGGVGDKGAYKAITGANKYLLKLHDGYVVETVGIPENDGNRLTVCVSSEVGCPMRCTFCATGKGGFARNLMPHEIVDQVLLVQEQFGRRVTNIVFMGMGEPLLNVPSVMRAHEILNTEVGIGARHITITTVGAPNAIMRLASYDTQSTLAVSIHAPNQKLREQIVPSAKAYPLRALMADCAGYFEATGRRVTFEYCLLAGENDGLEHAEELAALLRKYNNMRSHVNLIPWNPVDESEFKRPSKNAVQRFVGVLERSGIGCSVRVTRGLEAAAACGQLRNKHQSSPLQE